jgi:hypothetical protein
MMSNHVFEGDKDGNDEESNEEDEDLEGMDGLKGLTAPQGPAPEWIQHLPVTPSDPVFDIVAAAANKRESFGEAVRNEIKTKLGAHILKERDTDEFLRGDGVIGVESDGNYIIPEDDIEELLQWAYGTDYSANHDAGLIWPELEESDHQSATDPHLQREGSGSMKGKINKMGPNKMGPVKNVCADGYKFDLGAEPSMSEYLDAADREELSTQEEIDNAVSRQRKEAKRRIEDYEAHQRSMESMRSRAPQEYSAPKGRTVIDALKMHEEVGVLTVEVSLCRKSCGITPKTSVDELKALKSEVTEWMEASELFSGARRQSDITDGLDKLRFDVHNSSKTVAAIRWALENDKSRPWRIEIRGNLVFEWMPVIVATKTHSLLNRVILSIKQERSEIRPRVMYDRFAAAFETKAVSIANGRGYKNFRVTLIHQRLMLEMGSVVPWRLQEAVKEVMMKEDTVITDAMLMLLNHHVAKTGFQAMLELQAEGIEVKGAQGIAKMEVTVVNSVPEKVGQAMIAKVQNNDGKVSEIREFDQSINTTRIQFSSWQPKNIKDLALFKHQYELLVQPSGLMSQLEFRCTEEKIEVPNFEGKRMIQPSDYKGSLTLTHGKFATVRLYDSFDNMIKETKILVRTKDRVKDIHDAYINYCDDTKVELVENWWAFDKVSNPRNLMVIENPIFKVEKMVTVWRVECYTTDLDEMMTRWTNTEDWGHLLVRSNFVDESTGSMLFRLEIQMRSEETITDSQDRGRGGGKGKKKGKGKGKGKGSYFEWVTIFEGGSSEVGTQAVRDNRQKRWEEKQTGAAKTKQVDVSTEGMARRLELLRQQKSTQRPEKPTESTSTDPVEIVTDVHVTWDMHWRLPWLVRWKHTLVLGVGRQGKRRKKRPGSAKWRRLSSSAWICSEAEGANRHMQLCRTMPQLNRKRNMGWCVPADKQESSSSRQKVNGASSRTPAAKGKHKFEFELKLNFIRPATKKEVGLLLFSAGDVHPNPGPSFFIELYGGSMAAARAAKTIFPGMICICVDSESRAVLEKRYAHLGLAAFLASPGVVFIRFDLRLVTPRDLQMWCVREVRSAKPTDIAGVHASVVCTTLTQAGECNKSRENCAVSSHRGEFGMALSIQAQYDDKALRACLELLKWVAAVAPDCVITVENGWHSHFRKHDLIQDMIGKEGCACWQILKTDLCAAASPTLDITEGQRMTFPMKPTAVLVRFPAGQLRSQIRKKPMPRCAGADCPMIIEGQGRHQIVVCTKKKRSLEQQTEQSRAKISSILPRGLFDAIWAMAASAEDDTASCVICGQPGAQSQCRCGRKIHNICVEIMARGSDDARCTSCSTSDILGRHVPTMAWDALIEISNDETWTKGSVKGEGLRYICINNKSPKEVLHLDAPNTVHIQFDPMSVGIADIKIWCRMLGVKSLLGIRISIDTAQIDLEKGRPTASAQAQEELQRALNAISVGIECGEIEPEALVVLEAPLESKIWERRSVRKARQTYWRAELSGQPARSAMIRGGGQAEGTKSCSDAEIWLHHEKSLRAKGTMEATATELVYSNGQEGHNRVTELNTRDMTMAELEGYLQQTQTQVSKHAIIWTKHGHDMAARWQHEQNAEAHNGAWIVMWHYEEGEEKLGWEGQNAYSWNTAGFELLTQIASMGRAMCVVAGSWTEGFVGNTRIREMMELDWWMLETGCPEMPALLCKGIRPEDAVEESDPLNKSQARSELLQQMVRKRKTFLLQQDGWDYFCAVCENGGDLVGCDKAGCTRVQHREGSEWKEGQRWICQTCAIEEEWERTNNTEGHVV